MSNQNVEQGDNFEGGCCARKMTVIPRFFLSHIVCYFFRLKIENRERLFFDWRDFGLGIAALPEVLAASLDVHFGAHTASLLRIQ
jgi:hypothetical protein